jgi:hypothetical protein
MLNAAIEKYNRKFCSRLPAEQIALAHRQTKTAPDADMPAQCIYDPPQEFCPAANLDSFVVHSVAIRLLEMPAGRGMSV